ncbi:hypothetical protein MAR_015042 [Mya arenaria]|uniref:Uncharacterized protein n=1 Tax=Mya arenaria TaxID=6604 RepID=A0ABY7FK55_MYAAR|nr:hypothetical protein MAR_015042 [Mya arenaria]
MPKFYMYVDCDSCTVGYGTDGVFYGSPIRFERTALPVIFMNILHDGCCRFPENRAAMSGVVQTRIPANELPPPYEQTEPMKVPEKAEY